VTTPGCSVIICTHSDVRWNLLAAAVASAQRQTRPPVDVVVSVDHNPSLASRVRRELKDVHVVENTGPRGLSGARNAGIASAEGTIVAFLDDDAVASPVWLENLTAHYSDVAVLGVGGSVYPIWDTERPRWFPSEFDWILGCSYRGLPTEPSDVRNVYGGNASYRREIFEEIGGFRSGIGRVGDKPLGCEETELCIRARQRWPDRRFIYEPAAAIYHHVPRLRTRFRYLRSRCFAEGRSKARLTRLVGADDGLSSERTYVKRALPAGVATGIWDTLRHRDPYGLCRAGALIAGLGFATAGYLGEVASRSNGTEWQTERSERSPVDVERRSSPVSRH
jgi:GT2 family glycosyltransferase